MPAPEDSARPGVGSRQSNLFLRWLVANLIGFVAGSLLGAANDGVLVSLLPGRAGVLLGDLVFGTAIGGLQWLALHLSPSRALPAAWVLSTALGFALGARTGARVAPIIADATLIPVSAAFGACMGVCLGLSTMLAFGQPLRIATAAVWLAANVVAWIAGESIAFTLGFSQAGVSLVATVIASVSWFGLQFVWRNHPCRTSGGASLTTR